MPTDTEQVIARVEQFCSRWADDAPLVRGTWQGATYGDLRTLLTLARQYRGGDAPFAWTAAGGYKHYPPYVNLTGNKLVARGVERFDGQFHHPGERIEIELPADEIERLRGIVGVP